MKELGHYLHTYRHHQQIPGLQVNVVSEGKISLSQGFGSRTAENPYQLVDGDTIFSIQDITLGFTALALKHLEENNAEFSLDAPVKQYIPYFRTGSGDSEAITTRHILSHTAGFPKDVWAATLLDKDFRQLVKHMPEYRSIVQGTSEDQLAGLQNRETVTRYFSTVDVQATPGTSWTYCPDAYVIAADVLEKVSGRTYETYVQEYIFQALQMNRTWVNPMFPHTEDNVAAYYMDTIGDPIRVPTPKNQIGAPIGMIYSSANDLSAYLMAQMNPNQSVVTAKGLQQMHTSLIDEEPGYGLGWKIKTYQGITVVEHAGSYPGVSGLVAMVPEQQFGIIILANRDQVRLENISHKIMRMHFGK